MKRILTLMVGAVMLLTVSCSPYKYETVKGDLLETKIYTLDNGLKVYMSVNEEAPRVKANIAVKVGGKNDPSETTGLAHYFEHLMFKGTEQFGTSDYAAEKPLLDEIEALFEVYRVTENEAERAAIYHKIDSISYLASDYFIPNEYDKLMAAIGAEGTNAYTSFDVTCYQEDIPANQLENWAKIHNLKNASRAHVLYQEMGFDSPEALAAACDAAHAKVDDIRTKMKSVEASIKETKEFRDYVLNYHKTRYVIDELKACKNEKARQKYRDEHDSDFIILNAAKRYFDSKGLKKLPSHKALQTEVEQLIKDKNALYNEYQTAKDEVQRLDTIRHNIEQTLGRKIEHKQEQER